ncbi:FAD-binding oxidoreductase, partial [Patescibacteria group bacterium]|nr:FAD-binding oxidoreductase [Patescibacteria group bacterium]
GLVTFGLLTSAKLKLIKAPKYSRLIVIFSKSLEPIPEMVDSILPLHPDSIESYDDKTLKLAIKFFPALLALMKGSVFKMLLEFLPEVGMIIKGGIPKMILLVSVSADDPVDLEKQSQAVVLAAKKFPVQIRSVKDETEAKEYWTVRRQSFNLLHSHVKGMDAAPFIDDIIVDPKFMPEFLPQVNAVLDRYKKELIYTIAGHPGNGNFHIIPLVNLKDERVREIIPKVTEEIYKLVFRYGGSITAEHNDGLIRTPYLGEMYGEKIVSLFSEVKEIFDPLHIFNPGKKVGATLEYAARHMKK